MVSGFLFFMFTSSAFVCEGLYRSRFLVSFIYLDDLWVNPLIRWPANSRILFFFYVYLLGFGSGWLTKLSPPGGMFRLPGGFKGDPPSISWPAISRFFLFLLCTSFVFRSWWLIYVNFLNMFYQSVWLMVDAPPAGLPVKTVSDLIFVRLLTFLGNWYPSSIWGWLVYLPY